jgi:hypothetical protein
MRICLSFLLYLQFCILFDELLIKLCVDVDSWQGCLFWEDAALHLKLVLQLSHQVRSIHATIGWDVLTSSFVVLIDFLPNYRLCLSFRDEIHWMNSWPIGLRLFWILNLCLLRAFLSASQALFFCVDLFL